MDREVYCGEDEPKEEECLCDKGEEKEQKDKRGTFGNPQSSIFVETQRSPLDQ